MSDLLSASKLLGSFHGGSLRGAVSKIETKIIGLTKETANPQLSEIGVSMELMLASLLIKKNSAQINEIIHAIGILLVLPAILETDERVESVSLAAGNTGKGFDLETDRRIAEFTFIQWQGGSESIRQNKIFKDFFFLAEESTPKLKELYVCGLDHPTKFFNAGRSISSILKNNDKLGKAAVKLPQGIKKVRDYYQLHKHSVAIRDIGEYIPLLKLGKHLT